jgi:peptidoglycan/LPS O-acetylase OafA/YrhL
MKKAILVFIIASLVLITTGLWIYSSEANLKVSDMLQFGVILLIVIFALFIGIKRLASAKRGEPVEDEMSKKVLQKTASLSYYISLYLWVGLIFVNDRVNIDAEELIGAGILGMALTFAICWLIFNFRGVKNG